MPTDLTGRYVLRSELPVTASLTLNDQSEYTFCTETCETGKYQITYRDGPAGRILFQGPRIEAFYRQMYSDLVGEEIMRRATGEPIGSHETRFEAHGSMVVIDVEGTRGIAFVKED